jgi:homoserine O-acetyltransferase/O-succinyltransferase
MKQIEYMNFRVMWLLRCSIAFVICLLLSSFTNLVYAESPLLTQKQRHVIDTFTTYNGATLKQVQVGWESYGQLNADKSNVILITHYFTGNSHAAGKYHPDNTNTGYWDSIIGPGKAIDTNQYFVISVDSLANLSVYDPNVITTGPATINPDTGKAYGLTFPVVTMRDFVNVQKSVLESLGIQQLHAVVGASMGSMQAIEWASAYPKWVNNIISIIGSVHSDAWTTTALEQWAIPIKLDPLWQQGNYTKDSRPMAGLTASLMFITQIALHPEYINQVGAELSHFALEDKPLNNILSDHAITAWLHDRAASRAAMMDPNHLLYLVRACQLFLTGHGQSLTEGLMNIDANVLFIPANNDLLLMPYHARDAYTQLRKLNAEKSSSHRIQYATLNGPLGHLNGILGINQHAQTISQFLARKD